MKRNSWGSRKWYEIHTKTFNYPVNPSDIEKQEMITYILNLYKTIGCGSCKRDTREYITKYELQMTEICSSKENVFKFFVDFHNVINEKLHKPKLTYFQAYIIYQMDKILKNQSVLK